MIVRPATLADLNAIIDIAMEQTLKYPRMRADKHKVKDLVIDAISAARHYALVVERDNGQIDGALLAFTTNNAWAQRQNCAVLLWQCSRWSAGGGAEMLRKFRDWVLSRRAIKVAGFSPDVDLDPRVWMLAEKVGFKPSGGAYLLYN
jgi:hypothetical protein